MASCGNDDLVKVWHVRTSYGRRSFIASHTLEGHGGNVNCCRFSPDGTLLASV
jgi:WD40 repeat protein